jgi:hypothetical protein
MNFNSILTKYITLTRSIDILDSQRQVRDAVYLMLKYFEDHQSDEFFKQKIDFENFAATPSALLAMACWLQQMKYYKNPDKIIYDNCVIASSVVFRRMGTMSVEKTTFENNTFIVDGKPVVIYDISPEIASWKVVDFIKENPDIFNDSDVYDEYAINYFNHIREKGIDIETCRLSDQYDSISNHIIEKGILTYGEIKPDGFKHLNADVETIEDYMTRFRFFENGIDLGEISVNTTFGELLSDYKNQYPNLIRRITEKMQQSYDYREFQAWSYMLEQSRTNNSVSFIFKGHETFSDYINSVESNSLIDYVFTNLKPYKPVYYGDAINGAYSISVDEYKKLHNTEYSMTDICNVQNEIIGLFKEWVKNSFSNLVYTDESDDNSSSSFVEDMKLLFDEFLSVFSQLYSVDYNYSFGNKEYDGLFLQLFYNPMYQHYRDKYNDHIDINYKGSSKIKDLYDFKIELSDYIDSVIKDHFDSNINNELNEDQFKYYESLVHIKDDHKDYIGLDGSFTKTKAEFMISDNVGFHGVLNIKSDLGDKIYYEKDS